MTQGFSRAIIVMGVSGTGKSTIGRQLAAQLSVPFLEGDELHPAANVQKMHAGIALTDEDRWPWLDRVAEALNVAVTVDGQAVGTCSALKRVYREYCRARISVPVLFICLEASDLTLKQRMASRPGHFMPPALLSSQLAIYERPGIEEQALCINTNHPAAQIVAEAHVWLQSLSH